MHGRESGRDVSSAVPVENTRFSRMHRRSRRTPVRQKVIGVRWPHRRSSTTR